MAKKSSGTRGRPSLKKKPMTQFTLILPEEMVEFVDGLANTMVQATGQSCFSRSAIIRALLKGLSDVEGVERPLSQVSSELILEKAFGMSLRRLVKDENAIKDATLASWIAPKPEPEEEDGDSQG